MNLRILKKLSKRAAPYLAKLGDNRDQFRSERWDNYHGLMIRDRKHWDRSPCHQSYQPRRHCREIVFNTRAGRRVVMRPPYHPRKGTVMVGAMSGYYEPEWDEECAYAALVDLVCCHFTDWNCERPVCVRRLRTAREIFAAADDMLLEEPTHDPERTDDETGR